jgi:hypothetical protein
LYITCFFKEFDKLEKRKPCIDKIGGLKDSKVLEVVVGEGLTEVYDEMFYVGVSIE